MIHLLLLSYALTALLGTVSAVYAFQAYRSLKLAYLRPIYVYSIVFLISVFCGQILEYVYINILHGDFRDIPPKIFMFWILFLEVARLLMLYTIGRALLRMKAPSRKGLYIAGFMLVFAFQLAPFLFSLAPSLLPRSPSTLLWDVPKIGVLLAVALIGWRLLSKDPISGQRSLLLFGRFFFAWYAAQFAFEIILNGSTAYYVNSVLLLPVSAIPFLWVKYRVLREIGKDRTEESPDLSGRLLKSFNISPREEEVIRLILQGKSNKDIQAALFISHSTVKNHVYNIYQKMNVKSRLQLVSVVLNLTSSANGTP